jgi:23S rRNA pseudouridine1911/1915/1917 synthase
MEESPSMKILFEDNHLLVVEKAANLPMQADSSLDTDLLTLAKAYLKEKYSKPGNVYCGLVHRLDRPVGGVVVLAKTSKAASRLSELIRNNQMTKVYQAIVVGQLPKETTLKDYLLKDEESNTSKISTEALGKYSELSYTLIAQDKELSLIEIQLVTGRSHQIRVQFASRNCPLWGDQRYNKKAIVSQQIALWATSLSFTHPISKEILKFNSEVPSSYPWNLFEIS